MAAFLNPKGVASMVQDRYTKVVLTVLAVGVWALALVQAGTPAVLADAVDGSTSIGIPAEPVSTEGSRSGMPVASLPLRWYIPLVLHVVDVGSLECHTTIGVVNPNTTSVDVEIDFISDTGSVLTTESSTLVAGGIYTARTVDLAQYPNTGTLEMTGHARIHAAHPNVLPLNYLDCAGGDVSMTPLAVGATLDLFRADLPLATEALRSGVAER